jgi:hypothetical protein
MIRMGSYPNAKQWDEGDPDKIKENQKKSIKAPTLLPYPRPIIKNLRFIIIGTGTEQVLI